MKVVWVTPSMPHPQGSGGSAHEFELINALARHHQVHVVSCHFTSALDSTPLLDAGAQFTSVEWQVRPYPTGKVGVVRGLVRADPNLVIWLGRDRISKLAKAVEAVAADEATDLVQVTHGELAELLGHLRHPTGLLLFDALTRANMTRLAVEPLLRRRAQLRLEGARTRRFERRWYPRATGVASVSTVDARWLEQLLGIPVEVLENPIGDQFFASATVPRSADLVTFVGALTHHPNADAIRWLATEIWPRVLARRPEARLRVVGRADGDPTVEGLRALVEAVGGELLVDVPDIRPHYWEAAAVAAPLRQGSGLRNKVIHAMACGAPVVATPTALEGIPPDAAALALSALTSEEVAAAIVETLADPDAAARRAAAALVAVSPLRIDAIAGRHERWWAQLCR